MRCARCGKRIREVFYVNGKPYGSECAKLRGYSDKKVIIKKPTEIDSSQIDLFGVKYCKDPPNQIHHSYH